MHFCADALEAIPLDNYILRVKFADGKIKDCDISDHLDKGVFKKLKDVKYYRKVHTENGAIVWDEDLDMAPEYIYDNGKDAIYTEQE